MGTDRILEKRVTGAELLTLFNWRENDVTTKPF